MTREEEIKRFAHNYSEENYKGDSYEAYAEKEDIAKACVDSIKWADQHPRKGLWDAEKVCKYLENHAGHYMTLENDEEGELQSVFYQKGLIEDLRKAMED